MKRNICGVIVSETKSPEEAGKFAQAQKNCPQLLAIGTTSNRVYAAYIVPEGKRWWLRYPEQNPMETNAERATTHMIDNLVYPTEFELRTPKRKTKIAPCGADCQTCSLREQYKCEGCPGTVHYTER